MSKKAEVNTSVKKGIQSTIMFKKARIEIILSFRNAKRLGLLFMLILSRGICNLGSKK